MAVQLASRGSHISTARAQGAVFIAPLRASSTALSIETSSHSIVSLASVFGSSESFTPSARKT